MIQKIDIQNFRCFEDTCISGFKRINLIGGLNNSGKTALLEAIYLNTSVDTKAVLNLLRFRREDYSFIKSLPERAWNNFFFNQDHTALASIKTAGAENINLLEISCDNSIEALLIQEDGEEETEDQELNGMLDLQSLHSDKKSVLHLKWDINANQLPELHVIATGKDIVRKTLQLPLSIQCHLIPSGFRISASDLAREFDKSELSGNAYKILEAIQLVDPSIDAAKTLSIGKPALYLKRENQEFLPISLFGEAIGRVTEFVLNLVNNQGSTLLIDEIENGIHYTHHRQLWSMLFDVAALFDVQIFATTHSLEMIQAFSDAIAAHQDQDVAAYVELTRNIRNGKITGIVRESKELSYTLKRGVGVRGD